MAELRQPPPPRYRVVERQRRLEVIDTATNRPVAGRPAPAVSGARWWPRRFQFDGSAELVTHPLYDAKGPRTIRLDPGSARVIRWLAATAVIAILALLGLAIANLWLLLPAFLLWNGNVRTALRAGITRWLDTVAREAS